jgi:uncharacterized protein
VNARRTCAGCGRKAPQAELIRFVAREGVLTAGAKAPGRGVYTCRRLECFERAASNRGFARTLRTPVKIEPSIERIRSEFDRIDRSVQTDERAKPVRPEGGAVKRRLGAIYTSGDRNG